MNFKSAVAMLFAVPVISFAQVNTQACYEATSPTYGQAPKELCLVSIAESGEASKLAVVSGDINMPEKLSVTSISRHNEDRYAFKATAEIAENYESSCGDAFKTTLFVEGKSDYGYISRDALTVSVELWSTNDACHSDGLTETIQYKLKR